MAKKKVFAIGKALSQGLEETIGAAQHYQGVLNIDIISIRKIELDPNNPRELALTLTDAEFGIKANDPDKLRKTTEIEMLQSMVSSIKTQGIINPILVYKQGEYYRLIAGERRTLASILAGKHDIQAKILDDKPAELQVRLLQWVENIERSDLSLWERVNNLEKIVEAYSKNQGIDPHQIKITELANLIGCVKSHAMNYKALLNADVELKQLILENKIKNLEKAALISEIKIPELKQQAIKACIEGATLKQLKILIQEVKLESLQKRKAVQSRKTSTVQFGTTTNIHVAKTIVEALLNHTVLGPVANSFRSIDWHNHHAVTETFKRLLRTLEKLHA